MGGVWIEMDCCGVVWYALRVSLGRGEEGRGGKGFGEWRRVEEDSVMG